MTRMAASLVGGIVVVTAATGLLLSRSMSRRSPGAPAPGVSSSADDRGQAPRAAVGDQESNEAKVTRLLVERTASARLELVSLYTTWSADPERNADRRKMIHKIASVEEPMVAINMLSMAVAGDPTPLDRDELLPEAAQALAPLWKTEDMFSEGRDLMRLAEHDKSRALLAATLTARCERAPTGLAGISDGQRHELASDLIQVNMHTTNPALKSQTLANVRTVAGPEVAEVLADPANAATILAARAAKRGTK
jgi:hypothetical protein